MSFPLALLIAIAPAAADRPVFDAPVLTVAELGRERGGYFPRGSGRRTMAEANAISTLQIQAETNRLTFDNWFANEGTILIVNNILATR